jgi:hypothetical protein
MDDIFILINEENNEIIKVIFDLPQLMIIR